MFMVQAREDKIKEMDQNEQLLKKVEKRLAEKVDTLKAQMEQVESSKDGLKVSHNVNFSYSFRLK